MKRLLKWIGIGLGIVVCLVLLAGGILVIRSQIMIKRHYSFTVQPVTVTSSEAAITEGQRLYFARGCADCHSDDAAGQVLIDDPVLGRVVTANLTPAGLAADFTLEDFDRAVRHGVKPDGRPLLVMPSDEYYTMSDVELSNLYAYLRQVAPVETDYPPTQIRLVGLLLAGAGQFPVSASLIDHTAPHPTEVPVAESAAYGEYLARQLCMGCHGADLNGQRLVGRPPDTPPAANLTPDTDTGLGSWMEEDFFNAIRNGTRPDGATLSAEMPWRNLGKMTDTELGALWLYLQSLPAQPAGY